MNVKRVIREAFYQLLQAETIEQISVTQLVQVAEISKPTFYRHFRDKYDLLNQMFDHIFDPMRDAEKNSTWGEAMLQTLTGLEQHAKFFQNGLCSEDRHSLRNYNLSVLTDTLMELVARRGADVQNPEIRFAVRACAVSHSTAVVGWICDEQRMPKERFVQYMKASLPHNLYEYFTV